MEDDKGTTTVANNVLKTIDWFIDIPENLEHIKNCVVYSSSFLIEFNKVVTEWRLAYNLNGKFFMMYVVMQCYK